MAECILIKPGGAGSDDVTATKAQILSGYTAITHDSGNEPVAGTIAKLAAATYTPSTANQTIAANRYLSGVQTIKGDANLLAANIKKGVTIFGVAGAYEGKWVFHNGIVGGWGLSKKLYVPSNGGESVLDLGAKLANQVRTTARVNLNLYSKVKLTVSYGTNEYKVTNSDFRIYALDEQAPSSGVASKYIILGLLPSNTKVTYEFDISGWGGAYYLGVSQDSERTLGTHSSAYLKITEMWLE